MAVAWSEKVGPVNQVNHTSWVTIITPTDRPKSAVRNRCVIELFCGVVRVVTLHFWHFCWCMGFCHRTESDIFLFSLDTTCSMIWHTTRKQRRTKIKIKMLSRTKIEPMPTENQRVSGVKNIKSPITLTPSTMVPHSKWIVIKECHLTQKNDVNFTKWIVRFSDITKICPLEAKQIFTRQFNIVFVFPSRQV